MALDPNKTITQYNVQVWNMESGLPGNSVFAIRQTHDGFLWIGTQDGLVRFDGLNFELYTRGRKIFWPVPFFFQPSEEYEEQTYYRKGHTQLLV